MRLAARIDRSVFTTCVFQFSHLCFSICTLRKSDTGLHSAFKHALWKFSGTPMNTAHRSTLKSLQNGRNQSRHERWSSHCNLSNSRRSTPMQHHIDHTTTDPAAPCALRAAKTAPPLRSKLLTTPDLTEIGAKRGRRRGKRAKATGLCDRRCSRRSRCGGGKEGRDGGSGHGEEGSERKGARRRAGRGRGGEVRGGRAERGRGCMRQSQCDRRCSLRARSGGGEEMRDGGSDRGRERDRAGNER